MNMDFQKNKFIRNNNTNNNIVIKKVDRMDLIERQRNLYKKVEDNKLNEKINNEDKKISGDSDINLQRKKFDFFRNPFKG